MSDTETYHIHDPYLGNEDYDDIEQVDHLQEFHDDNMIEDDISSTELNEPTANSDLLTNYMSIILNMDKESRAEGKPALERLKKIDLVVESLRMQFKNPDNLSSFLFDMISEWLEPLEPDFELPALNIRNVLIQELNEMEYEKVNFNIILNSNIGAICQFLSNHPHETEENKVILKKLIRRWKKIIGEIIKAE
eukprot:TRINITY_DN1032_c0_g1_i1.p1 TRINITY_DN1032_c0_g1~~TRINITY_DN1032_c0_g1_i1.p1  ORF type:complete len:204 (+),score=57.03 TRINITY_DN1032_c0_g1_i1:34-612(+)